MTEQLPPLGTWAITGAAGPRLAETFYGLQGGLFAAPE